ncbi:hypothetical protein BJX70DRAFT_392894 [Aspergillus crustosus]
MPDLLQQHHHFIPRFILRKFAPKEQPPAAPVGATGKKSCRRDLLVNRLDLENGTLTQRPVSTESALVSLYRDPGFDENPYPLEEKLSRLEHEASEIINKASETFTGCLTLTLNGGMFDRYNHDDRNCALKSILDAMMFEVHLLHSFMTFCRPESLPEEFLLTENVFGIFEGPVSVKHDLWSQKTDAIVYTEHHNFVPLSPRLIIILRSTYLPAGLVLEDLPVHPCKVKYVTSSASFSPKDKFLFQCFRLSSVNMMTINSIFLEQAYQTSSVVYHSTLSLRATIENYFRDETEGFKHIIDVPGDERRSYFDMLEKILRQLGGSAKCRVEPLDLSKARIYIHMALNLGFLVGIKLLMDQEEGSLPRGYTHHPHHQEYLLSLTRPMQERREKCFVDRALSLSNLNDEDKYLVRAQRHDFLVDFPRIILWIYLKISRDMARCDVSDVWSQLPCLETEGEEGWFAEAIAKYPMTGYLVRKLFVVASLVKDCTTIGGGVTERLLYKPSAGVWLTSIKSLSSFALPRVKSGVAGTVEEKPLFRRHAPFEERMTL